MWISEPSKCHHEKQLIWCQVKCLNIQHHQQLRWNCNVIRVANYNSQNHHFTSSTKFKWPHLCMCVTWGNILVTLALVVSFRTETRFSILFLHFLCSQKRCACRGFFVSVRGFFWRFFPMVENPNFHTCLHAYVVHINVVFLCNVFKMRCYHGLNYIFCQHMHYFLILRCVNKLSNHPINGYSMCWC